VHMEVGEFDNVGDANCHVASMVDSGGSVLSCKVILLDTCAK
jgi:hypothetical protein